MTKNRERVLWTLGFAGLVAMLAAGLSLAKIMGFAPGSPSSPLVGQSAPEISLPLVTGPDAAEGDRISLGSLRGEVVLLDFWASWCGPCRHSIPALNEVHRRYGERIRMYGINVDRGLGPAQVEAAHASFGADFPSLRDEVGEAQMAYDVMSIPTVVLIDREGTIRLVQHGVPDPDDLADRIESLLAE